MKLKEYFGDRDIHFGDEPKRFAIPMPSAALTDRTEPYTAEELQRAADTVVAMERCLPPLRRNFECIYMRPVGDQFELVAQRITTVNDDFTFDEQVLATSKTPQGLIEHYSSLNFIWPKWA